MPYNNPLRLTPPALGMPVTGISSKASCPVTPWQLIKEMNEEKADGGYERIISERHMNVRQDT